MNNWTDSIYLVSYDKTKDSDGFSTLEEKRSVEIPANFKRITRAEEEHSKIMGYTANLVVELMKVNYNHEPDLIDVRTSRKYAIRRAYESSSEIIQLTCSDISRKNG